MSVAGRCLCTALVFLFASLAAAATPDVPDKISRLMQDRKFAEASAAIDEALAAAKEDDKTPRDYLLYLKGRALHFNRQYDEAIAVFDQMLEKHPKSTWSRRARFAKGVSFARKGDFRQAQEIYRAEAEYLLSLERKQEIADVYIEFAEAFFNPDDETKKPDYEKAREFYQKALEVGPQPESRAEIELKIARCYQELGQHAEAIERYKSFLQSHAASGLAVEARYRLGESQLAAGNPVEARRTWQDLLVLHKGNDSPRLAEAAFHLAETYGIPSPADDEALSLGVAALRAFLEKYPEHEQAGEAHLLIARSYFALGRHEQAAEALSAFLADDRYAGSDESGEARYLLGAVLKQQKKFDEALATWAEFLVKHPTSEHWAAAQREIIDTQFLKALESYRQEKYAEAREQWEKFLAAHPLDERAARIMLLFGRMNYSQEKWQAAIDDWKRLVAKYPQTEEAAEAQLSIGVVLEEKLGKYEEALEAYKKVTWGSAAGKASARARRLTEKSLVVCTERVFRSGETPAIRLTTRNIEAVTIRIYAVDLEAYFRKMHLGRGLETLDISLIDPDQSIEFTVPKYEKHEELENMVEVPLPAMGDKAPAAGVMAVTVSSETLEATTMVVQSDLDVIVKSSRDEVFVFAENMKTGEAWPEARVLVSDGGTIFAEGATGDDGVYHQALEELKSADDVRVFAVTGGHTASNLVSLSGVGVAQGLADRGYLYTDRPAYRPGQIVHVRGVIRKVAGDAFTVEEGKKYRVSVFDNRNRMVHEDEIELSEFGSLHTHFTLPASSPQGEYRIAATNEKEDESYQGVFTVHQYQLQPVRLEVDVPRTVYYRGEEIEGTIRATYYYGAPLPGKVVEYQLADGRSYRAKTDDQGEIHVVFPTRDFRERDRLILRATLPEQGVSSARWLILETQGFSLSAETARPVYIAGETFEAKFTAADAEGEPIATDLTLSVLKRTKVAGETGEVLVSKHDVKTDENGLARVTVTLDDGGQYILRAEGTDRFGNVITAQTQAKVSGDEDDVRLLILAEQHHWKVGDKAEVRVHWREAPALALVTFQGAKILDYRLVELKKGENKLAIPMEAKLAPNFELSIAVMTDARRGEDEKDEKGQPRRFHSASSPFTVERELNVEVVIKPKGGEDRSPLPGEEVEVTVRTTDPQGNPVSAEVSLALVEQALLAQFDANAAVIDTFFQGAWRVPAVQTTSSIVFDYHPTTKPINAALLAERDREEVLAEEAARLADLAEAGVVAETWDDVGGPGSLDGFDGNLSLIVGEPDPADPFAAPPNAPPGADPFGASSGNGQWRGYAANGEAAQQSQAMEQYNGQQPFVTSIVPLTNDEAAALGYRNSLANQQAGLSLKISQTQAVAAGDVIDFDWLAENNAAELQVIGKDGRMSNINLAAALEGENDEQAVRRFVDERTREGDVILAGLPPQETGYWNPSIVTAEDGTATVEFTLPDRSTAWTLAAKGITAATLAGEVEEELAVKKELFGQLKLPAAFTDGDEASVIATVHNDAALEGEIEVTLKATLGDKTTAVTKKVPAKKGIAEVTFKQQIELPEQSREAAAAIEFELVVAAGEKRDVAIVAVPVEPNGRTAYSIASGTAAGDTAAIVAPPEGTAFRSPSLQVLIGPSIERSLLDAVLAPPVWCGRDIYAADSPTETTASDLMASLALLGLFGDSRQEGHPQVEALDARIRGAVGSLVSSQNDDGGWSWAGGGASDRYVTAHVIWALSLAKDAGYSVGVEGFDAGIVFLQSKVAEARVSDYETKAALLHALAAAGHGDFTLANQLYRNRPALSATGLAYLSLAFAEMDRDQTAEELLALLAEKLKSQDATKDAFAAGRAPAEARAVYAVALEKVRPEAGATREQVDWLLAHRSGHRWSPDKATGPAMLAVARHTAKDRFEAEKYRLSVFVNDVLAEELEIESAGRTRAIDIDPRLLGEEKQTVRFELTGRGRYSYEVILAGFVPAGEQKSTTADWKVERFYEPAPREYEGRDVPRGFDVLLGGYKSFQNNLTELPVGRRGRVELRVHRYDAGSSTPDESLPYLVVREPLPAGVTVVEQSVTGGFDRFEIRPGEIVFHVGARRGVGAISFDVHGYLPGKYHAPPTVVLDAYRPDMIAVAEGRSLTVLPLGEESGDEYRLTPRELFELGKLHFDDGDLAAAGEHLSDLVANWNVSPDFYREAVRMLLDVHLKLGPPGDVVRYFEILVEKFPGVEISFDKLLAAGRAYHEIGEYERGYLVYRAAVEASFMRESRVAGFLRSQQELLRSISVMENLLAEYPPEGYTAGAEFALAGEVYAMAPLAAGDAKLREKKVTRVDLVRRAMAMLRGFLTAHPDDPAAAAAAFSRANAQLELEQYEATIAACEDYIERYPKSDYVDDYWYIIGFCHFALGNHEKALEVNKKVAEMQAPEEASGRLVESDNKWRAIYILGQIHHSLGEAAAAIREYKRVEDRFADARQAIDYFAHKDVGLPEVTTIRPGEPGIVELSHRNLAKIDVTVYRIDLMKFSLLRRNLEGITSINLAGIRPLHEESLDLGDGEDYEDRRTDLKLPLKEEGAYLVVARGEGLHASGMVLVSPLEVEVQEEVSSGRVRATVKNVVKNSYIDDVYVKVIGSRNEDFTSGETDLRGVFVADGIRGESTVIARAEGGEYAFFRGETPLGPPPQQPQSEVPPAPADDYGAYGGKGELLEGLQGKNNDLQMEQQDQLQQLYDNSIDSGIGGGFGGGLFNQP